MPEEVLEKGWAAAGVKSPGDPILAYFRRGGREGTSPVRMTLAVEILLTNAGQTPGTNAFQWRDRVAQCNRRLNCCVAESPIGKLLGQAEEVA